MNIKKKKTDILSKHRSHAPQRIPRMYEEDVARSPAEVPAWLAHYATLALVSLAVSFGAALVHVSVEEKFLLLSRRNFLVHEHAHNIPIECMF